MEGMKSEIKSMLQGIERYNPENIKTLEHYVDLQAREKGYDLEANLALLKLYQFNPTYSNLQVVVQILLKSLTNLPHTDFVLCKCLLSQEVLEDSQVSCVEHVECVDDTVVPGDQHPLPGRPAGDVSVQGVLGADSRPGRADQECVWVRGLHQEVRVSRDQYHLPDHQ